MMMQARQDMLAAIGTVEALTGRVHRSLLQLRGGGTEVPSRLPALVWEYVGDDPGDSIEAVHSGRDEWRLYIYAEQVDQFDELVEAVRGAVLATGRFRVYRVSEDVTDDDEFVGELRVVSNL